MRSFQFLGFALFVLLISSAIADNEEEIGEYLKEIDDAYKEMNKNHYEHTWTDSDSRRPEEGLLVLLKNIILTEEVASKLEKYDYKEIENATIKRQAKLLHQAGGYMSNEEDELIQLITSMIQILGLTKKPVLCEYNKEDSCEKKYFPDILTDLASTNDEAEMKHYWNEFRNKLGVKGRKLLSSYADLYARGAIISKYETPSQMYYAEFEDNILEHLELVVEHLKPFYKELFRYIRYQLNKQYGDDVVSKTGSVPQHLLYNLIVNSFQPDAEHYYPYPDANMPNITKHMHDRDVSSEDMLKQAAKVYQSIGFDELPSKFFTARTKEVPVGGKICHGDVYPFLDDVAGYKYCPNLNFRTYLQMVEDIGYVYYDHSYRENPVAFAQEAAPGFGRAIGQAFSLSQMSTSNMRDHFKVEAEYNKELQINRLYRLSLYFVLSTFERFIEEKLWVEILDGKVGTYDYNCRYWEHQNHYAGVQPPESRSEENFDVSPHFYSKFDNSMNTQFLFSGILGFEFYKSFCKITNEYQPENIEEHPLHECNLSDKTLLGNILKPILKAGRSEPWTKLVTELNIDLEDLGSGMVEYFKPLYDWLVEFNNENCGTSTWGSEVLCTKALH